MAASGQAWKLWAACIAETVDSARAATQTYVSTLAHAAGIDRTGAGRLLRRFGELGIFDWKAAPRTSKGVSELALPLLPRDVTPEPARDAGRDASDRTSDIDVTPQHAHSSDSDVLSDAHKVSLGTHRSSLSIIGASDRSEGAGGWEAERRASSETRAAPAWDTAALAAELDAVLPGAHGATVDERFPPFHGDERAGAGVGDDETSQLRWLSANPSKERARRQRDGGGDV